MFAIGVDRENVWVIQFTGRLRFTKEAGVKIFLHLFVHGGTRQKDFDGDFFV
jgi:hypothetical protein